MIGVFPRALTTRRRLVVDAAVIVLAAALAPLVEVRIPWALYLVGAGASSVVSTALLVNAFYRVDLLRDYAQLPLGRLGVPRALASAAVLLLLLEIGLPATVFGLRRDELAPLHVAALALALAAGVLVVLAGLAVATRPPLRLLAARGSVRTPTAGRSVPYFMAALAGERVIWVNTLGLFAIVAFFTAGTWSQGLRLPLAFALLAVNSPLATLISGDADLRQHLAMLGQPSLAYRQYAATVALVLGAVNAAAAAIYVALGARDIALLIAIAVAVTCLEAFALPFQERRFPILGARTQRDVWRHPRKYALPAVLLLTLTLVPLA